MFLLKTNQKFSFDKSIKVFTIVLLSSSFLFSSSQPGESLTHPSKVSISFTQKKALLHSKKVIRQEALAAHKVRVRAKKSADRRSRQAQRKYIVENKVRQRRLARIPLKHRVAQLQIQLQQFSSQLQELQTTIQRYQSQFQMRPLIAAQEADIQRQDLFRVERPAPQVQEGLSAVMQRPTTVTLAAMVNPVSTASMTEPALTQTAMPSAMTSPTTTATTVTATPVSTPSGTEPALTQTTMPSATISPKTTATTVTATPVSTASRTEPALTQTTMPSATISPTTTASTATAITTTTSFNNARNFLSNFLSNKSNKSTSTTATASTATATPVSTASRTEPALTQTTMPSATISPTTTASTAMTTPVSTASRAEPTLTQTTLPSATISPTATASTATATTTLFNDARNFLSNFFSNEGNKSTSTMTTATATTATATPPTMHPGMTAPFADDSGPMKRGAPRGGTVPIIPRTMLRSTTTPTTSTATTSDTTSPVATISTPQNITVPQAGISSLVDAVKKAILIPASYNQQTDEKNEDWDSSESEDEKERERQILKNEETQEANKKRAQCEAAKKEAQDRVVANQQNESTTGQLQKNNAPTRQSKNENFSPSLGEVLAKRRVNLGDSILSDDFSTWGEEEPKEDLNLQKDLSRGKRFSSSEERFESLSEDYSSSEGKRQVSPAPSEHVMSNDEKRNDFIDFVDKTVAAGNLYDLKELKEDLETNATCRRLRDFIDRQTYNQTVQKLTDALNRKHRVLRDNFLDNIDRAELDENLGWLKKTKKALEKDAKADDLPDFMDQQTYNKALQKIEEAIDPERMKSKALPLKGPSDKEESLMSPRT